jgi:hypothetical protein
MSWGHGEEHWRRDGSGRLIGQPPPPGMFRGRAGVLVEVAPNQFVSWQMHGSFGQVETEREVEEIQLAPLDRFYAPGLTVVRFQMEGILGALDDHAPRPDWAEPAGEIESRRALEGR